MVKKSKLEEKAEAAEKRKNMTRRKVFSMIRVFIYLIILFIYWIIPVDLIPDALPFVGILDDASVTAFVLWLFKQEFSIITGKELPEDTETPEKQ